jgi:beta-glucosidase
MNNGIPAADDYDLLTDLTRGEWGFEGMIMTDWGGGQSIPSISMHAGNDLVMPGSSVEDISVRGFGDEEPEFDEDGIYPVITISQEWSGPKKSIAWGEFTPDAQGDTEIIRTVKSAVYNKAVRDDLNEDGEIVSVSVKELLEQLGDAVTVTDNTDGTTTITYKGYYEKNNITLGDLQKSVIHILNIIMQSNQFADMFPDVEAVSYTEIYADKLVPYIMNEKSEIR